MSLNPALVGISELAKALDAGTYDAAPSSLTQGAALQMEDLSNVMNLVTFDETHIVLQKEISTQSCKSTTYQFNRQLSHGDMGGSAAGEGQLGPEETSDYVRVTVPMAYYSKVRRNTIVSGMVATFDGKKSPERAAEEAAISLSGDIEFDLFRGLEDFSNGGVFDGQPLTVPALPNMHGLSLQTRQSDFQANARDLAFAEFGSDDSVVLSAGSTLSQPIVEDAHLRSNLNFGKAKDLYVDPVVASNYNKLTFGKERIILAGSPQTATGGDLARQFVSGSTVDVKPIMFLRGKSRPRRPKANGPAAPTITLAAANSSTSAVAGDYIYYATSGNELGESPASPAVTVTGVTAGQKVTVTITNPGSGTFKFFNVYRTAAGGPSSSAKFIGRVQVTFNSSTTAFVDLFNRQPGFVTGILVQKDTLEMRELASFTRLKLAVTDLSEPEAYFRFCTLAVEAPRKNVIVDNLRGQL